MKDREHIIAQVRKRYGLAREGLDERGRRQVAAAEALTIGWGGVRLVAEATGMARATITLGLKELRGQVALAPTGKSRGRPGGGRLAIVAQDPTVLDALERLVEPTTRGDPESPLRWTCKSMRKLAAELAGRGHQVSQEWVRQTLRGLHDSLQGNRKTREGGDHPDRDAQFAHINATATAFLPQAIRCSRWMRRRKNWWVTSRIVAGSGGRRASQRRCVSTTFPSRNWAASRPMASMTAQPNAGWVSVGLDHDTAAFAVATVRRWWEERGQQRYPARNGC